MKKFNAAVVFLSLIICVIGNCSRSPVAGSGASTGNARVAGIVLGTDSLPVSSITVYLLPENYLPGTADSITALLDSSLTDSDGFFEFDSVESGHYVVSAVDTVISRGVRIPDILIDTDTDTLDLLPATLQPTGSITGILNLINPADKVTIKVYGLERVFAPNLDGSFLLNNLPAGTYELRFETSDIVVELAGPDSITLSPGAVTNTGPLTVPALTAFEPLESVYSIFADSAFVYLGCRDPLGIFYQYDITEISSPSRTIQYGTQNSGNPLQISEKNGFVFISGWGTLDIRNPSDIKEDFRDIAPINTKTQMSQSLDNNRLYTSGGMDFVNTPFVKIHTLDFLWAPSAIDSGAVWKTSGLGVCSKLAAKNGYVYLCAYTGIRVINATNPSNPFLADSVPLIAPPLYPYQMEVEIHGNYLYAFIAYPRDLKKNHEVTVFDLSNPVRPSITSSTTIMSLTNQFVVLKHFTVSSTHAFILSEHFVNSFRADAKIYSVDIQNPDTVNTGPVYCLNTEKGEAKTLLAWNEYLFIGTSKGLMILQVSN